MAKLKVSEADVKKAFIDRIKIDENQHNKRKLIRLNSGSILVCPLAKSCLKARGKLYKIQLADPGTSDYVYILDAIFFELKATGKKQEPEQVQFEKNIKEKGFPYFVIDDAGQLEGIL